MLADWKVLRTFKNHLSFVFLLTLSPPPPFLLTPSLTFSPLIPTASILSPLFSHPIPTPLSFSLPSCLINRESLYDATNPTFSNLGQPLRPSAAKELATWRTFVDLDSPQRAPLFNEECNVSTTRDGRQLYIAKPTRISNERVSKEGRSSRITPSLYPRRSRHFTGKTVLMITHTPSLFLVSYLKKERET